MQEIIAILILAAALFIIAKHVMPRVFHTTVYRVVQQIAQKTGFPAVAEKRQKKAQTAPNKSGCAACRHCPGQTTSGCEIRISSKIVGKERLYR